MLDAAAAIVWAAAPLEVGVLLAACIAIVSAPASPLNGHQTTTAWLLVAGAFLGFLGIRSVMRPPASTPSLVIAKQKASRLDDRAPSVVRRRQFPDT